MTLCLKKGLFLLIFFFLILCGFSVLPTGDSKEKITRAQRAEGPPAGKGLANLPCGTPPDQLAPEKSGWMEEEGPHRFIPIRGRVRPHHAFPPPATPIQGCPKAEGAWGSLPGPSGPLHLLCCLGLAQGSSEKQTHSLGRLIWLGLISGMQRSFDRLMFSSRVTSPLGK